MASEKFSGYLQGKSGTSQYVAPQPGKKYKQPAILGTANAKTIKGEKLGWRTAICYMSPADSAAHEYRAAISATQPRTGIPETTYRPWIEEVWHGQWGLPKPTGATVCPLADRCKNPCLVESGKGDLDLVRMGRLRRTLLFFKDGGSYRDGPGSDFARMIRKELAAFVRTRPSMLKCVRMNGTSDFPWEDYDIWDGLIGKIQRYDYTKITKRVEQWVYNGGPERHQAQIQTRGYSDEYHLTFSLGGKADRLGTGTSPIRHYLAAGVNLAAVWENKAILHKAMEEGVRILKINDAYGKIINEIDLGANYKVIDGNYSDLRFTDPQGVIVGLYMKTKTLALDIQRPEGYEEVELSDMSPSERSEYEAAERAMPRFAMRHNPSGRGVTHGCASSMSVRSNPGPVVMSSVGERENPSPWVVRMEPRSEGTGHPLFFARGQEEARAWARLFLRKHQNVKRLWIGRERN